MKAVHALIVLMASLFAGSAAQATMVISFNDSVTQILGLSTSLGQFDVIFPDSAAPTTTFSSQFPAGPQFDFFQAPIIVDAIDLALNMANVHYTQTDELIVPYFADNGFWKGIRGFQVNNGGNGNLPSDWINDGDYGPYQIDRSDFSFAVLQPVPVPAALWLLGSALGGLGFARRCAA